MTELAIKQAPAINNMDDLARVADMLSKSGYFEDARSAAQCGVKVLAGAELGIPAFSAMAGIHIVKGKPTLSANLMAAKVKGSGKYDYRVKDMTDEVCTIAFYQNGDEIGVSTFTKADAARAGTQNMGKFPRNMLFARAMSNGVRWFTPDVFLTTVYTPDELGAQVDEEGNVVDAEVRPVQEPKQEPVKARVEEAKTEAPKQAQKAVWESWRSKDDPVHWAVDQTDDHGSALFNHHNHAQNSYDKARREYLNSLTKDEQPKDGDDRETKWRHSRALNAYFFEKIQAKKRGEDFVLPAAGSQRIFEDIGEAEGVSFEDVGA